MKTATSFMEKPSCISQLKDLAESLTDRDANLKKCMSTIKKVIHDENLSSDEIVIKLKDICKTYGK